MTLPTIISGPILRRVESRSVSVWLACSKDLKLTLNVYQADSLSHDDINSISAGKVPTSVNEARTARFGDRLWIAVVTAKTNVSLAESEIYSYNVEFSSPSDSTVTGDLKSEGFLKDKSHNGRAQLPIGYEVDHLPTFSLSQSDPTKLFIAQTSCRKMHGPGPDALAYLDSIIKDSRTSPTDRPQQLFLSGDQMYADDVPGLIFQGLGVSDLIRLDTWDPVRVQADVGPTAPPNQINHESSPWHTWPPYLRQGLIREEAGMTSGEAKNHLLTFGEYSMLYLCYWGNRAWNNKTLAALKKVEGDPSDKILNEVARSFLDSSSVDDDSTFKVLYENIRDLNENNESEKETLRRFKKAIHRKESDKWLRIAFGIDVTAADRKEKFFNKFIESVRNSLIQELRSVSKFTKSLPAVSRVLANVPTYMVFDDHEVTDDWYLTKRWKDLVLSKPLGRDIVRNGLMAYAVFQDWGNVPDEYVPLPPTSANGQPPPPDRPPGGHTPRTKLIRAIMEYVDEVITQPKEGAAPPTQPIEKLETLLGLIDAPSEVKWHYNVRTGPSTTLVLDTRTRRQYDTHFSPPGLLNEEALQDQIPTTNPAGVAPFIIVVSPAPVPGMATFEEIIQPLGIGIQARKEKHDSDIGLFRGQIETDLEGWGLHIPSVEALYERLSAYPTVIVFGGDVHYSFSSVLDYWKSSNTEPVTRILSFTASSAKNEPHSPLRAFRTALFQKILTSLGSGLEKVGWKDRVLTVSGPATVLNRMRLREEMAVLPVDAWIPGSTINRLPDFRWRLRILADDSVRNGDPVDTDLVLDTEGNITDETAAAAVYEKIVARAQENFITGVHRRMVWSSNVGLLKFEGTGSDLAAKHQLLYAAGSRNITAKDPKPNMTHQSKLIAEGDERNRPALP